MFKSSGAAGGTWDLAGPLLHLIAAQPTMEPSVQMSPAPDIGSVPAWTSPAKEVLARLQTRAAGLDGRSAAGAISNIGRVRPGP
jgi:hypothetical protein